MGGYYKPKVRICMYCGEEFYGKNGATKRRHCYKDKCVDRHAKESPDRKRFYQAYYRDTKLTKKYWKRYSLNKQKPEPELKVAQRPSRRCRVCGSLHCGRFDMCAECQGRVRDYINTDCMYICE